MDLSDLLSAEWWILTFGLIGILAIIFAETGLLIGFFLPGDSLLVVAGIGASATVAAEVGLDRPFPLPVLLVGAPLCAIAGAQLGHLIGAKTGPRLFSRPDSRLFKQKYVERARHYFERFGPARAVVLARFIPIVRTFLNPVAGMLGIPPRRFLLWNVVGGVLWTDGLLLLGYLIGTRIPHIDRYILPGAALIILLSVIPIVREVLRNRREAAAPSTGGHRRADVP
ncbi:membrane-associated protein [Thermocatellispora tengchongensis]|uniref:Membrane-associated protein n=1 Tax=Thermocatellispora tengchongensis TaxID=1073253 RepID=A0A840NVU9_9ACTN|nr:VTT domain-containing protein [Thermocatellispora tengchongensis]MBB5130939.1 membrane-associated protein [Thermocatellispora tengchongensis]